MLNILVLSDIMTIRGYKIVYTLNKSRTKTATYKYSAWGETLDEYNSNKLSPNPIRYSGEYEDSESGMIYLRNRYYDISMQMIV